MLHGPDLASLRLTPLDCLIFAAISSSNGRVAQTVSASLVSARLFYWNKQIGVGQRYGSSRDELSDTNGMANDLKAAQSGDLSEC